MWSHGGPCTIAHFLCTLHDMILCTLIFCNFTSHFALMHPRRNGLTGGACPAMGAPLIALILIGHLYIAPRSTHHSTHDDGAPPEGATGLRSPCRLSCRQLAGCSPGEYQNSIVMVVQRKLGFAASFPTNTCCSRCSISTSLVEGITEQQRSIVRQAHSSGTAFTASNLRSGACAGRLIVSSVEAGNRPRGLAGGHTPHVAQNPGAAV